MKFMKESAPKGIKVPAAALKISHIPCGERVEMHALDNSIVLLKGRMTAPELLAAAQQLSDMASGLLTHLSEVCGPCESCEGCQGNCPYDDLEDEPVSLPDYLRQEAGIPEGAKLCAEVDDENHYVVISAAEHRYDLRDLPPELVDTFAEAGTCLAALEEHLILEDIVYGK